MADFKHLSLSKNPVDMADLSTIASTGTPVLPIIAEIIKFVEISYENFVADAPLSVLLIPKNPVGSF